MIIISIMNYVFESSPWAHWSHWCPSRRSVVVTAWAAAAAAGRPLIELEMYRSYGTGLFVCCWSVQYLLICCWSAAGLLVCCWSASGLLVCCWSDGGCLLVCLWSGGGGGGGGGDQADAVCCELRRASWRRYTSPQRPWPQPVPRCWHTARYTRHTTCYTRYTAS